MVTEQRSQAIEVRPGAVTEVNLEGCRVTGAVRLSRNNGSQNKGTLGGYLVPRASAPNRSGINGQFTRLSIAPDGTFSANLVCPGQYDLYLGEEQATTDGRVNLTPFRHQRREPVIVPDGLESEVLDLGTIEIGLRDGARR